MDRKVPADEQLERLLLSCIPAALLILALAALAIFTLPLLMSAAVGPRPPKCSNRMKQFYRGLQAYLNNSDQYFPLAWHVGGSRLAENLSNLTFHRALIGEYAQEDFHWLVSPGRDPVAAQRQKFTEVQELWTDPTTGGWTRDYISPEIVFRMPDPQGTSHGRHEHYEELTRDASPTQRPLLADVNASLPNPEARDPNDPEHEAEMRKGFSVVKAAGTDVFVGVGPSLRRAGDYSTSRFDFRHRGMVNVLFLDGHVESVNADQKARLEKIHRYWNSIDPASNKEPDK